jgi:hypothetical protein
MFLVEVFLPITDNEGHAFPKSVFAALRRELTDKFGGVTSFNRAPAEGTNESGGDVQQDDIIIMEVMTDALDRTWWSGFRKRLEKELRQEEILIRASSIEKL